MPPLPSIKHAPLAREGRAAVTVAAAVALFAVAGFGSAALWLALPVLVLVAWFYRDPNRRVPSLPLALLAPCNGRVLRAEAAFDVWLGRDALCTTVHMGLLDVHSLYSPIEGKVVEQWSTPRHGSGPAPAFGARVACQIRTDEGDDVVLEFSRNRLAGALRLAFHPGERVGQGRRVGFAPLGCRVSLYCAADALFEARPGARVSGAETVLVNLVHERPVSIIASS